MQKHCVFLLLIITTTFFIFLGCSKVEENVEGTWLLERMEADPKEKCIWDFKSNNELIITYYDIEEGDDIIMYVDSAYYTIEKELTYTSIKVIESGEFFLHPPVNGFFRVDKISENLLVITRYKKEDETTGGAYLRREFTRVD